MFNLAFKNVYTTRGIGNILLCQITHDQKNEGYANNLAMPYQSLQEK